MQYNGEMDGKQIQIEFYGIPRQRAGVAGVSLAIADGGSRLSDVLTSIGQQFPELANDCFDENRLLPQYSACINGDRFVSDPDELLQPGQALMILSADAGG